MPQSFVLPRFSIGVGDRFAHQAKAQLRACVLAAESGIEVIPVWNKSNREHTIIGSDPAQTRAAADAAVHELGWSKSYFLDADHIGLGTVDRFLEPCDFFTLDVADHIGTPAAEADIEHFASRHPEFLAEIAIPGVDRPYLLSRELATQTARKFLAAVQAAGRTYRHIEKAKGPGQFVTEISMDETDAPQSPVELLMILAMIADERVPIQTIAPKFTGRFNKGVDYQGDVAQFEREFREDAAAIAYAVERYGLPQSLKLSVHSGSDKFALYAPIHRVLDETGAGLHLKTAGTTWLEEIIGLAESGLGGFEVAQEIYADAYAHRLELSKPYATVIAIDDAALPLPEEVQGWSGDRFVRTLRHNQADRLYNPSFRQLLHVGFKIAARMGTRFLTALEENDGSIARNVTENLYERHIRQIFPKMRSIQ